MKSLIKNKKLTKIVKCICTGQYKEYDLVDFVNLLQKISLSYLKYQEVIGKHIRWERDNNSNELEDLALDCVAGLFMRNDKGEFVQLIKYFKPYLDSIEEMDEVEVLVLLRRLVIKKTKQELSRIFKERDPEGAKIVRNIKVAIKSCSDFASFKEMGREFIYLNLSNGNGNGNGNGYGKNYSNGSSNGSNGHSNGNGKYNGNNGNGYHLNYEYLRKHQPSIPEKSLRGEFLNLFRPKDPVSTGIRKMLLVVQNDERYQNFLALDMIARIMRYTNLQLARDTFQEVDQEPSPLDELKLQEIEKRKNIVLNKIHQKIQNQYIKNNKLSPQKGEIYFKALRDILDDISQGKNYDSYFKHLKRYMLDLTQKAYRSQERTIFEYLGKLIKKWFREELIELL